MGRPRPSSGRVHHRPFERRPEPPLFCVGPPSRPAGGWTGWCDRVARAVGKQAPRAVEPARRSVRHSFGLSIPVRSGGVSGGSPGRLEHAVVERPFCGKLSGTLGGETPFRPAAVAPTMHNASRGGETRGGSESQSWTEPAVRHQAAGFARRGERSDCGYGFAQAKPGSCRYRCSLGFRPFLPQAQAGRLAGAIRRDVPCRQPGDVSRLGVR